MRRSTFVGICLFTLMFVEGSDGGFDGYTFTFAEAECAVDAIHTMLNYRFNDQDKLSSKSAILDQFKGHCKEVSDSFAKFTKTCEKLSAWATSTKFIKDVDVSKTHGKSKPNLIWREARIKLSLFAYHLSGELLQRWAQTAGSDDFFKTAVQRSDAPESGDEASVGEAYTVSTLPLDDIITRMNNYVEYIANTKVHKARVLNGAIRKTRRTADFVESLIVKWYGELKGTLRLKIGNKINLLPLHYYKPIQTFPTTMPAGCNAIVLKPSNTYRFPLEKELNEAKLKVVNERDARCPHLLLRSLAIVFGYNARVRALVLVAENNAQHGKQPSTITAPDAHAFYRLFFLALIQHMEPATGFQRKALINKYMEKAKEFSTLFPGGVSDDAVTMTKVLTHAETDEANDKLVNDELRVLHSDLSECWQLGSVDEDEQHKKQLFLRWTCEELRVGEAKTVLREKPEPAAKPPKKEGKLRRLFRPSKQKAEKKNAESARN